MKNIITILAATFFIAQIGLSQETYKEKDPQAKAILEKLNTKYKSYNTIDIDFIVKLKGDGVNETIKGNALKKGDKYAYDTEDYKVVCDGRSVWTYVKDDNVVTITSTDDAEEDEEVMNPAKLLTIWEKGFKYQLVGSQTIGGVKTKEIRLFPENPKKSKFHTISLFVDEAKNEIAKISVKGRDAVNIEYAIKSLKGNQAIPDGKFKFDASKYPGIEENDMRF